MPQQRWIQVFSTGCPLCAEAIALVARLRGDSDRVVVHDMTAPAVVFAAFRLGIRSVPTILIDGRIVGRVGGTDEAGLRAELGLLLE